MTERDLPPPEEMLEAFQTRDAGYDGIFVTAVKTTGIFCRPSCPARKPNRENISFYSSAREALAHGFRPCKRCRPLELPGETPRPIRELLKDVDENPVQRIYDQDLRERNLDPRTVRRWFKKHHGMTFHAYQRGRRLAQALGELANGRDVTQTAFESGYESLSGFQEALQQITGQPPSESRNATVIHLSRVLTPLGPMLLGATDEGVCLLEFTDRRMLETQLKRIQKRFDGVFVPGENSFSRQLKEELEGYFAGEPQVFQTPPVLQGSPFQQRVWEALRDIPYGETRSYGDQARAIGKPQAVRAVARANGDNRMAIVIPCHRVIGSDGSLTGYGGGLWRKRWLLHHEGAVVEEASPQVELVLR